MSMRGREIHINSRLRKSILHHLINHIIEFDRGIKHVLVIRSYKLFPQRSPNTFRSCALALNVSW